MKRHIPGLHHESTNGSDQPEGVFLVRVDRVLYRWHPTRPFYLVRFSVLEPEQHRGQSLSGRIYCTPKALWNSMKKLCLGSRALLVFRTPYSTVIPS